MAGPGRHVPQYFQVLLDLFDHVWAAHLDDDFGAVGQNGGVGLTQRGTGQRLEPERGEDRRGRCSEFAFDDVGDDWTGDGGGAASCNLASSRR